VHSVIGGVAGNNPASIALHLSFGFEQVAHLREVGHKFGQWIDVTYFQLLI
jgi:phosphinothricin acetyltransferase